MRTSKDIYQLKNKKLVAVGQGVEPPEGSKLWIGYNYQLQEWWFEGKKDVRTLTEIRTAIAKGQQAGY